MKEYICASDIGSVLIGNEQWTFAVPNVGGDGDTACRVYDSDKEFCEDWWYKEMTFISSAQGRFGIFESDCDFEDLRRGEISIDDAVTILVGRYGVYKGEHKVAFVKWEEWR